MVTDVEGQVGVNIKISTSPPSPPTRAEIKSDTSRGKDRVYQSLYIVVHSLYKNGIQRNYNKGDAGQVISRGGTTQSK